MGNDWPTATEQRSSADSAAVLKLAARAYLMIYLRFKYNTAEVK